MSLFFFLSVGEVLVADWVSTFSNQSYYHLTTALQGKLWRYESTPSSDQSLELVALHCFSFQLLGPHYRKVQTRVPG